MYQWMLGVCDLCKKYSDEGIDVMVEYEYNSIAIKVDYFIKEDSKHFLYKMYIEDAKKYFKTHTLSDMIDEVVAQFKTLEQL